MSMYEAHAKKREEARAALTAAIVDEACARYDALGDKRNADPIHIALTIIHVEEDRLERVKSDVIDAITQRYPSPPMYTA